MNALANMYQCCFKYFTIDKSFQYSHKIAKTVRFSLERLILGFKVNPKIERKKPLKRQY